MVWKALGIGLVFGICLYLISRVDDAMTRFGLFIAFLVPFLFLILWRLETLDKSVVQLNITNESLTKDVVSYQLETDNLHRKNKAAEKRLQAIEQLAAVSEQMLQNPDKRSVIDMTFSSIRSFLSPDHLAMYLFDRERQCLNPVQVFPQTAAAAVPLNDASDLGIVHSFNKLKVCRLHEFPYLSLRPSAVCRDDAAVICVPMFVEQERIGVIEIGRGAVASGAGVAADPAGLAAGTTGFDHFELNTLLAFAHYLTIALRTADLMDTLRRENDQNEMELSLAQELQQSFIPPAAVTAGPITIDFHHQPLREIGGDFYDYFPLDQGRLGILFGDVSGKGIPAALIVSLSKAYFANLSPRQLSSPARVLTDFNTLLTAKIDILHHFIALFFGILDPEKRTIRFAFAGLEAPVLFSRAYAPLKTFESDSTSVGMNAHSNYHEVELNLTADSVFMLYTDGLSDMYFSEQQPAIANILTACQPLTGTPKERLVALLAKRAGDIKDDITFAIIQSSV